MAKTTRALSGSAKDAFLDNIVLSELEPASATGERIATRLKRSVAQMRVRLEPEQASPLQTAARPLPQDPAQPFDPFAPNVIVLLRKSGREAALSALTAIDSVENLRTLAREQQLGIGSEPASAVELRSAIIAAAERRIANRKAAAS